MSAFNTVTGQTTCPICGERGEFEIQFKYGKTWQLKYNLGDAIQWGGNEIGNPDFKKVSVEGISNACFSCGRDMLEFDVIIIDNIIKELVGIGESRTDESELGYRTLE